jgi:hypothetical protein
VSERFRRNSLGDLEERAALLEFSGGMTRHEAERQAAREIADSLQHLPRPPGILGELIAAASRCWHPEIRPALADAGLLGSGPLRGLGYIVPDGPMYRPAAHGENGTSAIIVPSVRDGDLVDLVAQDLRQGGRLHSRLDVAEVIGADEIDRSRRHGFPLWVTRDVVGWLRRGARGIVVVRWECAGAALDGVRAILAPVDLAHRLHAATRRCWPRPLIAVPKSKGIPDAR